MHFLQIFYILHFYSKHRFLISSLWAWNFEIYRFRRSFWGKDLFENKQEINKQYFTYNKLLTISTHIHVYMYVYIHVCMYVCTVALHVFLVLYSRNLLFEFLQNWKKKSVHKLHYITFSVSDIDSCMMRRNTLRPTLRAHIIQLPQLTH